MTNLLRELADRCEGASGASRTLDIMIYEATHPDVGHYLKADGYTASLDAAIALKPADWRIGFEENASCDEPGKSYAWCWPFESSYDPDWKMGQEGQQGNPDAEKGYAATPALAICAAALRALASTRIEGEG